MQPVCGVAGTGAMSPIASIVGQVGTSVGIRPSSSARRTAPPCLHNGPSACVILARASRFQQSGRLQVDFVTEVCLK